MFTSLGTPLGGGSCGLCPSGPHCHRGSRVSPLGHRMRPQGATSCNGMFVFYLKKHLLSTQFSLFQFSVAYSSFPQSLLPTECLAADGGVPGIFAKHRAFLS